MTSTGSPAPEACALCADIDAAERRGDAWTIARLQTGYVRLNPTQYYRGASFFVAKVCVAELHELDRDIRDKHLAEMAETAAAIYAAVRPRKMNYEALGNSVAHLHWWLTPRHTSDPQPTGPIWTDQQFMSGPWDRWQPPPEERDELRRRILDELERRDLQIEWTYL